MARIPDKFLGCVAYIYPSRKDAEEGNKHGATGFFVRVYWTNNPSRRHVYAVTNKHVIARCPVKVVVRATRLDGTLEFIERDPSDWHPSLMHDISVLPIELSRAALLENVSDGLFVSPENFEDSIEGATCLGPGDEVFMIGRFISHDGKVKNHPSTRFGNLSTLAAPIKNEYGLDQESFAVDMRSISGNSGSPAFIFWEFGGGHLRGVNRTFDKSFIALLGVDWGHIPLRLLVLDENGKSLQEKFYVNSHTSMCAVVPAWHLRDLLNYAALQELRMRDEEDEAANLRNEGV
jgi:hypothetical protein